MKNVLLLPHDWKHKMQKTFPTGQIIDKDKGITAGQERKMTLKRWQASQKDADRISRLKVCVASLPRM